VNRQRHFSFLEHIALAGTLALGSLAVASTPAVAQFASTEEALRPPPPAAPRFTRYWNRGEYTNWRRRVERWCEATAHYAQTYSSSLPTVRTEFTIPSRWYEVLANLPQRKHIGLGPLEKPELIVLHMTEGNLCVSMSKMWLNANAHITIDRDGTIHRLTSDSLVTDHAGRSFWDGEYGVSRRSLSIEIVGFNKDGPTDAQYAASKWLVAQWQREYGITDENVVAHYQVAAEPRLTSGRRPTAQQLEDFQAGTLSAPHTIVRERRTDGTSFDWERFGITRTEYDPDIAAGVVKPNRAVSKALLEKIDANYSFSDALAETIARLECDVPRVVLTDSTALVPLKTNAPSDTMPSFDERESLLYQGKNTRVLCK
jgi:N-acetyl-anhydromuramyl-L-alanine amidase AmpD